MNLYKNFNYFLLSLFFITTKQNVCTDAINQPIIVQRTLGTGSQGKAEEVLMNRKKYVLKTFLDKGFAQENLNEAAMHKSLSLADEEKKNIVTYVACFKKNNSYQMLMEYFSSNWDSSYYRSNIGKLSENERAKIYKSLIKKIKFIHDQGFIHCDLKPDNIFCDIQDISKFKIGDFGLSKYQKTSPQPFKCSAGALGYVAPETFKQQINPKDFGKYDMYSLGIIIGQIEADRSCDVLELILGLVQKDESQRFDEIQSLQILDYVINDTQPAQDFQPLQMNQNQIRQKYQPMNDNPYGLDQEIKPMNKMGMFQNKPQVNLMQNRQNKIIIDGNAYQSKNVIGQNNFFNAYKDQQVKNQFQDISPKRKYSLQQYGQNIVQPQRLDQQMNIQKKRGISNQQMKRNQILAQRNQSNNIWGALNQNPNKFLI